MNLLEETLATLSQRGLGADDVEWVGSSDGEYSITWHEFAKIASITDYDSGYGAPEIAQDLVIVGNVWWLERGEYDGSEWWEYKTAPVKPHGCITFQNVKVHELQIGWKSLKEVNTETE